MLLQDLSQILVEDGVSASQKEHILSSIKDRSTPLEEEIHEEPEDIPREAKKK